ncbi:hypothetical protein DLM45_13305 [Hyphomicrobium methylovorum]|nr:hypothetical protein [Hyphomicrobium methylovorum]
MRSLNWSVLCGPSTRQSWLFAVDVLLIHRTIWFCVTRKNYSYKETMQFGEWHSSWLFIFFG